MFRKKTRATVIESLVWEKKRMKPESGCEEVFELLLFVHQVHTFEGSTVRFYSTTVLIWELA